MRCKRGAGLGAVLILLTACGTSATHSKTPTSSTASLRAAEPATAPPPSVAPAGQVLSIADGPQGIVYDAVTSTLVVAVETPPRLLLLDPSTLAVRTSVDLPGTVRHLQLARPGGPVLVPSESARQLIQVGLPSGAILASTAVGRQPHDAAGLPDGTIVVGDEFSQSLSIIRNGQVAVTASGVKQPGGIVDAGNNEVAVVDVGAFTVSTFDPVSGKRTAVLPAGAGPTHAVLTPSRTLVVVDTRGNRILTYALDPLRAVSSLALPGTPYGIALDSQTGLVWVTLTATDEVVGLDVSGPAPRVVARYPTVEQPDTVAVAPGSGTIWIAGSRTSQVERITR
jgi:DNA-binding beta-propeller fold protein YncE